MFVHVRGQDDAWHRLMDTTEGLSFSPNRLVVEWDWKDQGWGNQKGRLRLVVVRKGSAIASVDLSRDQMASHYWEHRKVVIDHPQFLAAIQSGDVFRVQAVIGGGGGHELFVTNVTLVFAVKDFVDVEPEQPFALTSTVESYTLSRSQVRA